MDIVSTKLARNQNQDLNTGEEKNTGQCTWTWTNLIIKQQTLLLEIIRVHLESVEQVQWECAEINEINNFFSYPPRIFLASTRHAESMYRL